MIAKRDDVIAPLTSLRFFAAFAVILFHSGSTVLRDSPIVPRPIATFFLNGYVGVTFFFVLSGFILQLVYSGRLKGRQAIGKFFEARFARIYPVYLLALLMVRPFMAPSGAMSAPQFALLQQWTITGQIDFDNWNMPAWTLSLELLFYLLFPLLNRLVSRLPKVVIFLLITCSGTFILVTASSFVVSNLTVPQSWMAYIPVPILRLPEFVIGVCLGELASRGGRSGRVSTVWLY